MGFARFVDVPDHSGHLGEIFETLTEQKACQREKWREISDGVKPTERRSYTYEARITSHTKGFDYLTAAASGARKGQTGEIKIGDGQKGKVRNWKVFEP